MIGLTSNITFSYNIKKKKKHNEEEFLGWILLVRRRDINKV